MQLSELVAYADRLLAVENFSDYCPNGLQVQGRAEVRTLVGGVTACQALLDAAIERQADALLVHHGYFWKGEDPRIVGIRYHRLRALLRHDLSLLAYHLPLDAHPLYGNNIQLAARLNLIVEGGFGPPGRGPAIGCVGALAQPASGPEFAARIAATLGRQPLHLPGAAPLIRRLAWCTGAAQSYLETAIDQDVDAFLTGEISEPTVHLARESGLHYFAAGHHATERYGVQALGAHLAERFALNFTFVDIANPV
ncbi:MAG: Nif3-like dinuclear metal center hexameric protein [Candidatus Competibacter sp.]|nr:Nif3-like dinuclear metal center hexameric protein [Candidatus Competibacter sp.]MDG4606548.1 Nif3-like dinuclear metal center hexameric protein [Candidatus Contendobacter sp.]HRD50049.1 Nif3-like dinuclear metal center hexameric protein [Candidatus Contendobacter sp.]